MKTVDILFIISAVFVPLLLISLNYSAIADFYTYSVPLNNFVIEPFGIFSDPNKFQKIKQQENSICFVTPSNNEYCYESPRGDEDFKFSYPVGTNNISGEMHFEPVTHIEGYWTMSAIVPISNNTAIITFSDNNDRYPPNTLAQWNITEEFEFTKTVEKYDTFVSHCSNNGKHIELIQYMGIVTIEEIDYVATWHVGASSEQGISCNYPKVIKHSFGHDFGI